MFSSIDKNKISGSKLITIGDRTSYNAIKAGLKPDIIVYDGKERRKVNPRIANVLENLKVKKFTVKNPAGRITEEAWRIVKSSLSLDFKHKIFVDGEEDLIAFPFLLESEEGTVILYGLKKGIVLVKVDKSIKNKCKKILKRMKGL